jgi:ammonium transporter Rh
MNDYSAYRDIAVMVFFGIGFLMAYLKRGGFSSAAGTYMLVAFALQWSILVNGFFANALAQSKSRYFVLDIRALVNGLFNVVPIMLSFGVVLGKTSLYEMTMATLFEVVFVGINNYIGYGRGTFLGVVDLGGTIFLHMFGAYFGFAFAWVLRSQHRPTQQESRLSERPLAQSNVQSDLMVMMATFFLFIYWPTFNGAFGMLANDGDVMAQVRAVLNTIMAQIAGTFATFVFSRLFRRTRMHERTKFHMADIQNASLAAGVAIGATCDQIVSPAGAMAVGVFASLLSVLGFVFVQPWLERRFNLHDSCGVGNLHLIPGTFGGFVSVIVTACAPMYEKEYGVPIARWYPNGKRQYAYQLAGMAVTIGIAVIGGALTAFVTKFLRRYLNPITDKALLFSDETEFHVPKDD